MFKEHPSCKEPKNKNIKIWRFMDLSKFLSILEKQALFFVKLSKLDSIDPLEGYLSHATVREMRESINKFETQEKKRRKNILERNLQLFKKSRNILHVSSWHMNKYESAAMWKLYIKSGEGIAIQSTYKRLIESFTSLETFESVGVVEYIDYDIEKFDWKNAYNSALHKRKGFEHEKELRAIVMDPRPQNGKYISVDLNILIENIFLAPTSPSWLNDLIKGILLKYGLKKKVMFSRINEKPLY
jgi:hypothetical protein